MSAKVPVYCSVRKFNDTGAIVREVIVIDAVTLEDAHEQLIEDSSIIYVERVGYEEIKSTCS